MATDGANKRESQEESVSNRRILAARRDTAQGPLRRSPRRATCFLFLSGNVWAGSNGSSAVSSLEQITKAFCACALLRCLNLTHQSTVSVVTADFPLLDTTKIRTSRASSHPRSVSSLCFQTPSPDTTFFFSPFRQNLLGECNLLSWLCSTRKRAYELFCDQDAEGSFDSECSTEESNTRMSCSVRARRLQSRGRGERGCDKPANFLVFRWRQENKNFLLSFDACTLFLSTFFFLCFQAPLFLPQSDRCLLAS